MSLTNLPAEMRLTIYDLVIHQSTHIVQAGDLDKESVSSTTNGLAYLAPWCSLMLVCKQIRSEMIQEIAKRVCGKRSAHNTWVLGALASHYDKAEECTN